MQEGLKEQFHYYIDNQAEFVREYNGKVIALKDFKVIGVYDSEIQAVMEAQATGHELGTFLVQKVTPGTGAYTAHIATPQFSHG